METKSEPGSGTTVDVVIPVLNEAHVLERSVETVRKHLAAHVPYRWRVVIANNGSTDGTGAVADTLAARHADVKHLLLNERGRGRALRLAWTTSTADVCCYTDVDLSTDLEHLRPLIDAIVVEGCDVATGSRLLPGSRIKRGLKRDVISRLYNVFVKVVLGTTFSDAQCGFKAVSRRAIEEILPQVKDQAWFLDTELLVLAEKQGYRIKDIPVKWIDDDDSRVKIVSTAWEDVKGVFRVRKALKAARKAARSVKIEQPTS